MGLFDIFRKKKSIIESGILDGSTDCHSHILFGVDDGSPELRKSLRILSYLEKKGVKEVWCTPHIMEDIPTPTEELKRRFETLKAEYEGPIKLNLAAEYMLDTLFEQRLESDDLLLFPDKHILVETSMNVPPFNMWEILDRIIAKGYTPVLAHPERYFYLEMPDYESLRNYGVKFQLNLPSVVGHYGETVKNKSWQMLNERWYDRLGSDCHRLSVLKQQYEAKALPSSIIENLTYVKNCSNI